jgi:hypothetical protein
LKAISENSLANPLPPKTVCASQDAIQDHLPYGSMNCMECGIMPSINVFPGLGDTKVIWGYKQNSTLMAELHYDFRCSMKAAHLASFIDLKCG